MNKLAASTLLRIARCSELEKAGSQASPCHGVVSRQHHLPVATRQVPEPWRGSTRTPILFISSNPSIDLDDDSPVSACQNNQLANYFETGFPPEFPRIRTRIGGIRPAYVRFWAHVRARASELLECERYNVRPGIDFALTELVHCKSEKQRGVSEALLKCVGLHWERIQRVMNARVFVALGKVAGSQLGVEPGQIRMLAHPKGGVRWLLALPHPNSSDENGKTFARRYRANDLMQLRTGLHSTR